jgi:hypothetical protein
MGDYFTPIRDLFAYVSEMESSVELRGSSYVHPWITVVHVIGMCVFGGTILMMDLRLLGIGNMRTSFSHVQRRLFPWQIGGMVVSAITGLALVFANPMNYVANVIFWTKMLAMVVAALNAIAFHFITEDSLVTWDSGGRPPFGARLAGGVSIVLWANVIVAGRLIPYANTWFG